MPLPERIPHCETACFQPLAHLDNTRNARIMGTMKTTYKLAMAAGWDAGNRSMRKAGRTAWNHEDYKAAAEVVARLLMA